MQTHRLNWRFHFLWVLLALVILLGSRVIYMLLTGQVVDENDQPLTSVFTWIVSSLLAIVMSSYLMTVIRSLRQLIAYRGAAFTLTSAGIENTLIVVNLLAFVFVFPIRLIPWSSVRSIDLDDGVYIRVKRDGVQAGSLSRLALWILGFPFCAGMIKPKLAPEEIEQIRLYCRPYAEDLSWDVLLSEKD